MQTVDDQHVSRVDASMRRVEEKLRDMRIVDGAIAANDIKVLRRSVEDLRSAETALVAEHRRLEEERECLLAYRELFENASDAWIITDELGEVVEANRAAGAFTGRSPRVLVGRSIGPLLGGDGGGERQARDLIARALNDHAVDDVSLRMGREPSVRDVVLSLCVISRGPEQVRIRWQFSEARVPASPSAGGGEAGVTNEQATAIRDEFLGLVSHELKTPLAVIAGNAEVLARRDSQLAPEQRAAALIDIRGEAERLHRMVDNMLVLARLERGEQIGRDPLDVGDMIDDAVMQHRIQWPSREFTIDVAPNVPRVDAAPTYVEQALRNVMTNAEQHSPPGAPITIRASVDGAGVEISILDRGEGVSDAEAELLFTPFYRARNEAPRTKGVGVGLAVARRLIEAQHGRIWAHPRFAGGLTLTIWLPASK